MPLTNEQRKAMVLARKGLQARIARKLDLSEQQVSRCVATGNGSVRLKREVARRLRLSLIDVFPPPAESDEPVARSA